MKPGVPQGWQDPDPSQSSFYQNKFGMKNFFIVEGKNPNYNSLGYVLRNKYQRKENVWPWKSRLPSPDEALAELRLGGYDKCREKPDPMLQLTCYPQHDCVVAFGPPMGGVAYFSQYSGHENWWLTKIDGRELVAHEPAALESCYRVLFHVRQQGNL